MGYDNTAKVKRQTATRDDLNGGKLQIMAPNGTTVLAEASFGTPSGTVAGAGVLTFTGFPKVVSALAAGDAGSARYVRADGSVCRSPVTVGLPGSAAEISIDNGQDTLAFAVGDQVTIGGPFTLAHAA